MARGPRTPGGSVGKKKELPHRKEIVPNLDGRFKRFMPYGCANPVEKLQKVKRTDSFFPRTSFAVEAAACGLDGSQNQ